jgi:pre-mRNA-processing factor 6
VTSAAEVQDIKRARTLMKSMVTSNPSNARGWIAYARLEEVTGNLKAARTIIGQVCLICIFGLEIRDHG